MEGYVTNEMSNVLTLFLLKDLTLSKWKKAEDSMKQKKTEQLKFLSIK